MPLCETGARGQGIWQTTRGHAEQIALDHGIPRVFALTNRAADFFASLGYSQATVDALPQRRRAQFEASGRDSLGSQKIFPEMANRDCMRRKTNESIL
jgi:amino-acid N-acetyltransferase